MKKYFTFGLVISMVSVACFAQHPMIAQLISEKQAKMEKLEKCQGTTKNLKIAGISTLGITAVGVGANIAEAVVLKNTKEDVEKAKKARDAQQTIKDKRECEQDSTKMWQNGECKDKPVRVEQEEKNSEENNDDKGGEKSDGANGNGDQEGKKTGDNDPNKKTSKGDAGEPAQQKSDEKLFAEACVNAGYDILISSSSSSSFVCDACDPIGSAIPGSKAYVDNALITAARKMNMGCNGSIYTKQNKSHEGRSYSYMDCLGGRLCCFHNTTAIDDDTKKQAKDLLGDIEDENRWKKWNEEIKQVEVPYAPTPEQVKQSEPKVSLKPDVLKNMERADEIIDNKLPCKSDERFDFIMNVCVKK